MREIVGMLSRALGFRVPDAAFSSTSLASANFDSAPFSISRSFPCRDGASFYDLSFIPQLTNVGSQTLAEILEKPSLRSNRGA